MRSLSEIETAVKRASRAIGFSWGVAEEVGKCVRLLELFGLPGIKNVNQYFIDKKVKKFENLNLIIEKNLFISMELLDVISSVKCVFPPYFSTAALSFAIIPVTSLLSLT